MAKRSRKFWAGALLALVAAAMPLAAQEKPAQAAANMPKVGDVAPDFKLQYFDSGAMKEVSLDQYRGKKNVVLAFYIFAFTGG